MATDETFDRCLKDFSQVTLDRAKASKLKLEKYYELLTQQHHERRQR
jgi:hypothetical protein